MLVLTRKPNESIVLGDNTVITVLEVVGRKVRLGIKAPPHVSIWREELMHVKNQWHDKNGAAEPDHLVEVSV